MKCGMKKSLQNGKKQDRQCKYKCNIETSSPNHCCHAKAIRINPLALKLGI